jgi:DNA-binding NtrC family response regulator
MGNYAPNEGRTIRLLLVDDEVDHLQLTADRLELRGFEITAADSGRKAIEAARKGRFDLALLDLKMPGMDGKEVLATLKKRHKFLEIIILTGHGSLQSAVECTKLGAFDYLTKPFDLEQLMEILKRAYEERLKKKFRSDKKRTDELAILAAGSSPMGILRALVRLDDDEK